jgi:hypothetical protein
MDAVKAENKKLKAKAKLAVDGIAQDVAGLKRQVRPIIPALHQMLRLAGQSGATGQTAAAPGPEPVRKVRPKSVGIKGALERSVGSSASAGHGNVLRTPFGQRDVHKEAVNIQSILAKLESVAKNLDGINDKISGKFCVAPHATFIKHCTDLIYVVLRFVAPAQCIMSSLVAWQNRTSTGWWTRMIWQEAFCQRKM